LLVFLIFIGLTAHAQTDSLPLDALTYFGVYRLAATDNEAAAAATGAVLSPGIGHAGMNSDGTMIGWSSATWTTNTIYLSDFDGDLVQSMVLDPSLGRVGDFEVAGDRAFFIPASNGIWTVDAGGVVPLFTALDAEIPRVSQLEVTADGEWVYFVVAQGRNQDDIYRMPAGQTTPMRFVDNQNIPCPAVNNCRGVWTVTQLAISGDASTIGAVISGYFVENEPGQVVGVDHDEIMLLTGGGYRYLTDGLPFGRIMNAFRISPDGSEVLFVSQQEDANGALLPYRWFAIDAGGGNLRLLPEQPFNHARPAFVGDSSWALLDLSMLVSMDADSQLYLFPHWDVTAIALASTSNLAVSMDGTRIAFTLGSAAFYVGTLNDPQVLVEAPIQITNVDWSSGQEFVLTVTTQGDVEDVVLDFMRDGSLLRVEESPVRCAFAPHDSGNPPDAAADDGVFTTSCTRTAEGDITLRVGAATPHQGWVVVLDLPLIDMNSR
jgi:hypothetical protein